MRIDYSGDDIKIFDFNAAESYHIARKLESDGVVFYERLRERATNKNVIAVFDDLLEQERRHVLHFDEHIQRAGEADDHIETIVDVVDSGVFSPLAGADLEDALRDSEKAIKLSLSLEKRSIIFYKSILENTSNEEGKDALENIIREEESHIQRLQAIRQMEWNI